ncbi:hypothetical protein N7541_008829 [Penicillium brevicompactum]|uniref:Uncharacterized protein n=1 Tax=Penicillium brevicompactum TaxID=5074 RepID=A0A9W9R156_PENBR|nr:hypothetical protein N7541_008829 [Penicillium brevicompactum]
MPRTRASSEDPHSKQPAKRQKRSAEAEAVQREDSIFSARTEISEDTKATNIENAYAIIENYNLTSTRQHDDLVQPTLRAFLEFLPEDGKHSLLKDINSAMDDDQKLYQIFHNLYTSLRTPSKFDSLT